jgi:hypothetical protein
MSESLAPPPEYREQPQTRSEHFDSGASEQRLRLLREDAQRRFDTLGLPRASRLSEVQTG